MARLKDGDRAAFAAVYSALRPSVLAFAQRLVPEDAEDVAQLALLDVFKNASAYDPQRDAMTWVLGITAWKCRTARKKTERRREVALVDDGATADGPEGIVERANLLSAVEAILGNMSAADNETILAAAGLVDRPDVLPATYRKRLERALGKFRRAWRAKHGVE